MSHRRNLFVVGLRLLCVSALAGMAACQTMGSSAEQRAFVAAHVIKSNEPSADITIDLAQGGVYAHPEAPAVVAQADTHP